MMTSICSLIRGTKWKALQPSPQICHQLFTTGHILGLCKAGNGTWVCGTAFLIMCVVAQSAPPNAEEEGAAGTAHGFTRHLSHCTSAVTPLSTGAE